MKKISTITLALSLIISSCSSDTDSAGNKVGYGIGRGVLAVGTLGISEAAIYGARKKEEKEKNLAKDTCIEAGLKEGTSAYAKCFIEIKKIQLGRDTSANTSIRSQFIDGLKGSIGSEDGSKVYNASECIGPIIMGKCQGSILENQAYHQTCHGEMLNGQCTGPMF